MRANKKLGAVPGISIAPNTGVSAMCIGGFLTKRAPGPRRRPSRAPRSCASIARPGDTAP